MKHFLFALFLLPVPAWALDRPALLNDAVQNHILPRYAQLAITADALETAAASDCDFESPALRGAYHTAFDAWIATSHLRFGPSEVDNRAFAMAFWPDKKGFTPKVLNRLITDQDPIVDTPHQYARMPISGRGFFALDMLMFDPRFAGSTGYSCRLLQAITVDISDVSDALLADWQNEYAGYLRTAGSDTNPVYLSEAEGVQELFKAVLTGLEFTQGQRLARPMGSFERPRPKRAEAWRSARSQRNIAVALASTLELTEILTDSIGGGLAEEVNAGLAYAVRLAENLDDPALAGVATPNGRFKVEALQSGIIASYEFMLEELGPALGVNPGFNALGGD